MLLIEWSPPFQWRPKRERAGKLRRVMWGYLAIAYYPGSLNEFVKGAANAGAIMFARGEYELVDAGRVAFREGGDG